MLRVEWAVLVGGMFAAPGPSAGRAAHGVTEGLKLLLNYRSCSKKLQKLLRRKNECTEGPLCRTGKEKRL